MTLYQRAPFQTADSQQVIGDESDQEQDALVNYQEQEQFDDGMGDLDRTPSLGGGGQLHDMQAQLAAAATPLEYQATLETKFASYDSYCNLFHYILNSEGPVDLEVPSVSPATYDPIQAMRKLTCVVVLLGLGRYRRIHLSVRIFLPLPQSRCAYKFQRGRSATPPRQPQYLGMLLSPKCPLLPDPALTN